MPECSTKIRRVFSPRAARPGRSAGKSDQGSRAAALRPKDAVVDGERSEGPCRPRRRCPDRGKQEMRPWAAPGPPIYQIGSVLRRDANFPGIPRRRGGRDAGSLSRPALGLSGQPAQIRRPWMLPVVSVTLDRRCKTSAGMFSRRGLSINSSVRGHRRQPTGSDRGATRPGPARTRGGISAICSAIAAAFGSPCQDRPSKRI